MYSDFLCTGLEAIVHCCLRNVISWIWTANGASQKSWRWNDDVRRVTVTTELMYGSGVELSIGPCGGMFMFYLCIRELQSPQHAYKVICRLCKGPLVMNLTS